MRFISPRIHGVIDFLVVLFLIISPMVFQLSSLMTLFTYALASVHLILTLLTDFNAGVYRLIPFWLHGFIELIVGLALIVLTLTLFKNAGEGRIFYVCFGTTVLVTWLFTNYKEVTESKG